jgi:hypothetical protein
VPADGSSPPPQEIRETTGPAPTRSGGGPWIWALIACGLLGASGAVRAMQDRRHQDERSYVEECPITLSTAGYDLRLMPSVKGVDGLPAEGKDLIVVAVVDGVLHFRVFDRHAKMVVDTDEKRLTERSRKIENLREELGRLWAPHELAESEKARVITEVTSIVGYTPSIPNKLGVWHLVEDGERTLDPLTTRITGSSQHMLRTYADDLTGVTLTVLVLYGPAVPVLPHTPEVCYPSSGYARVDGPSDSTVKFRPGGDAEGRPASGEARFRSAVYQKSAGRLTYREAAYHSFRLDGKWSPDVGAGRKFPRRNPGIFKIQVQRQVAEGESLGQDDPMEQFLSVLLTELEAQIKKAEDKTVAAR